MHIFLGQRFPYNPLEGGVEGAYFRCSSNGWIKTELFYGEIKNHFSIHVGRERPVLLLVDGHTYYSYRFGCVAVLQGRPDSSLLSPTPFFSYHSAIGRGILCAIES